MTMFPERSVSTLNIADAIHADKQISHSDNPVVLFYYGTFNPPHLGHLNAVKEALERSGADFAVIAADSRSNKWKPYRTTFRFRTEMLKLLFKDESNILVGQSPTDTIRNVLLKNACVIHLIGSDVFPRYLKDKIQNNKCHYLEVMVCDRGDETIEIPESCNNTTIRHFTQQVQGSSSTAIRDILNKTPDWYITKKPDNTLLSLLPEGLAQYILEEGAYSASGQETLKEIVTIIKSHHKEDVDVESSEPGLSGNLLFTVYDRNRTPLSIVKGYRKSTFTEEFINEAHALKLLESLNLQKVKFPKLLWFHAKENYALIAQSLIPGQDMGTYWKESETSSSKNFEESMKRQSYCIGRALNELHSNSQTPMNQVVLKEYLSRLTSKAEKIFVSLEKKLEQSEVVVLKEKFYALLESYCKNPGKLSYVHGDANPGNFFVDNEGKVIFIDLEGMGQGILTDNSPAGFPAYEYFQFISALAWYPTAHHTTSSVVAICQENFEKGYASGNPVFTKDAENFYRFFWSLRTI